MKFPAESQRKSGISARMYGLMVVMCVAMQAPAQEPSIGTTEADPICKGWLLELLDGDIEAARESYRIAAEGEDSTHLQRTLAQARLLEIARLGGHTQEVKKIWEQMPAARLSLPARFDSFSDPLQPLRPSLRARANTQPAAKLSTDTLRLLADLTPMNLETRPLVNRILRLTWPEGSEADTWTRRAELLTRREQAKSIGDGKKLESLNREIRQLSRKLTSQRRKVAEDATSTGRRAGTLVIELRLAGDNRQADRIAHHYYQRWGRYLRANSRDKAKTTRKPKDEKGQWSRALASLKRHLQQKELADDQRLALTKLEDHLLDLAAAGKYREAMTFLRNIPFFGDTTP